MKANCRVSSSGWDLTNSNAAALSEPEMSPRIWAHSSSFWNRAIDNHSFQIDYIMEAVSINIIYITEINFIISYADCKETSVLNEQTCEFSTATFRPKQKRVCYEIIKFIYTYYNTIWKKDLIPIHYEDKVHFFQEKSIIFSM